MSTSTTKAKSKPAKVAEPAAPSAAAGADRPETIAEEQENESMSIQETSISRLSRHQRTGVRDKTVTNITQLRLENTYKLKPDIPFRVGRVNEKINQILSTKLSDFTYTPEKAPNVTMELASSVKAAVKQLKISRHKLVVLVNMLPVASDCRPSVVYASRCLWNTDTDSSTSVVYNNRTATVVVLVFGLYFD